MCFPLSQGKSIIHATKQNKDKFQSLHLPVDYPNWEYKSDFKESDINMFNPISWREVRGRKHPAVYRTEIT